MGWNRVKASANTKKTEEKKDAAIKDFGKSRHLLLSKSNQSLAAVSGTDAIKPAAAAAMPQ